ncbi:unnamed protein product [Lampetra planeri]
MEEEGGGVTGRRFPEPMGAARRTPSAVAPRGQGRPGGRGEEVRVVVVVAARVEDGVHKPRQQHARIVRDVYDDDDDDDDDTQMEG